MQRESGVCYNVWFASESRISLKSDSFQTTVSVVKSFFKEHGGYTAVRHEKNQGDLTIDIYIYIYAVSVALVGLHRG